MSKKDRGRRPPVDMGRKTLLEQITRDLKGLEVYPEDEIRAALSSVSNEILSVLSVVVGKGEITTVEKLREQIKSNTPEGSGKRFGMRK